MSDCITEHERHTDLQSGPDAQHILTQYLTPGGSVGRIFPRIINVMNLPDISGGIRLITVMMLHTLV